MTTCKLSTDSQAEADSIEGELEPGPLTIDHRRANCSLDDAYIFNYTNNPKAGKSAALRAAGFDSKYLRQEAHRMHNRLRPKIREVQQEISQDFGSLSNQQLYGILNSEIQEVGYQVMLGAIKLGYEYSGHEATKANTKPIRPNADTIQQRINSLQKQIEQATGK